MKLPGRTAVVTGAGSGVGRAVAVDLARHGAHVVAVDIDAGALESLAGAQSGVTALHTDLATAAGRRQVVEITGAVDVLVNNVGVAPMGPVSDLAGDEVEATVGLNVVATIDLTRLVLPGMLARRRGHVVNIGSINGWLAFPPVTLYSATKAAVGAFSDGLRRETLGRGVDVTLVTPGPVRATGALASDADRAYGLFDRLHELSGVPPSWVALAVRLAVEHPGWPGTRTVAVPPVVGLAWLATVPGVNRLVDVAVGVLRGPAGLD